MELVVGQVVTSRKGRDVTKAYVVLEITQQRVILCDGDKRNLAAAKSKNPSHVQPTSTVIMADDMKTDLSIKRVLKMFDAKRTPQQQGG